MRKEIHENQDFSGRDFRGTVITGCRFTKCSFDNADMTAVRAVKNEFINCSFRRTQCYRTDFRDSVFPGCVFEPLDLYGATFTMQCKLWENTEVGQLWWFMWMMMMAQATPPGHPVKADLKQALVTFIGDERYVKLRAMMQCRDF
jgi:uncharacterized protein YjbI with pentapeptide repeats